MEECRLRRNFGSGCVGHMGYSWSGFANQGVQIAHAHTGPFASPGSLGTAIASDQGIEVQGINQVSYRVRITNIHPTSAVRHNLQGGGVS